MHAYSNQLMDIIGYSLYIIAHEKTLNDQQGIRFTLTK